MSAEKLESLEGLSRRSLILGLPLALMGITSSLRAEIKPLQTPNYNCNTQRPPEKYVDRIGNMERTVMSFSAGKAILLHDTSPDDPRIEEAERIRLKSGGSPMLNYLLEGLDSNQRMDGEGQGKILENTPSWPAFTKKYNCLTHALGENISLNREDIVVGTADPAYGTEGVNPAQVILDSYFERKGPTYTFADIAQLRSNDIQEGDSILYVIKNNGQKLYLHGGRLAVSHEGKVLCDTKLAQGFLIQTTPRRLFVYVQNATPYFTEGKEVPIEAIWAEIYTLKKNSCTPKRS